MQAEQASQRRWRGPVATASGQTVQPAGPIKAAYRPASPPGVIGGAIIQAPRRSASLTRRSLARLLKVSPGTVRAWENGTIPSFCWPYNQIQQIAEAFSRSRAHVGCDRGELLLASRCDLLLTGVLHGFEDYAEVPPIDEDSTEAETARDLLRWALTGPAPDRYRPYAPARPLLGKADADLFTGIARDLQAGLHGDDLTDYGSALLALI